MRYLHLCAHEQFPPEQLLRQAVAAEDAGFDGIGSGEALNEVPLGARWPSPAGMEEALEMIRALWGERLSGGGHFKTDRAYIHSRPENRRPRAAGSGRVRSRTSSTATSGTTSRRCTRRASAKSPTTS